MVLPFQRHNTPQSLSHNPARGCALSITRTPPGAARARREKKEKPPRQGASFPRGLPSHPHARARTRARARAQSPGAREVGGATVRTTLLQPDLNGGQPQREGGDTYLYSMPPGGARGRPLA